MTKEEYLLLCLVEECQEVSQRVTKALRFGLYDIQKSNPEETRTNIQRIKEEFNDLLAVAAMLEDIDPKYGFVDVDQMIKKKLKLEKYMEYSKEQGILK